MPQRHTKNLYTLCLILYYMHVHIANYSYACYDMGHFFPSKNHIWILTLTNLRPCCSLKRAVPPKAYPLLDEVMIYEVEKLNMLHYLIFACNTIWYTQFLFTSFIGLSNSKGPKKKPNSKNGEALAIFLISKIILGFFPIKEQKVPRGVQIFVSKTSGRILFLPVGFR